MQKNKTLGLLNTKTNPNTTNRKKNRHTSNLVQPPSFVDLQPSKTIVEQPKPNGGDASSELPFIANARCQQNPVVNKPLSSTNPYHPQTLTLSRFSRERDSATLCYLLCSTPFAIFLRQTNHSKNHCRYRWEEELQVRGKKGWEKKLWVSAHEKRETVPIFEIS